MALLFEDFVRREIAWHCRAIEIMSELPGVFRAVEGEKGAEAMREWMVQVEAGNVVKKEDTVEEEESVPETVEEDTKPTRLYRQS